MRRALYVGAAILAASALCAPAHSAPIGLAHLQDSIAMGSCIPQRDAELDDAAERARLNDEVDRETTGGMQGPIYLAQSAGNRGWPPGYDPMYWGAPVSRIVVIERRPKVYIVERSSTHRAHHRHHRRRHHHH